ncbi:SPW repeat protein [Roseomonas sp. GCM10028921]
MRFVSTRVHGTLDYLSGIVLIVLPWLLGFADGRAAQWVPVAVGVILLVSSLLTDYELSIANIVPMPVHLGLDFLAGVLLVASPWVFGFSDRVWLPHVVFGAFEIIASLVTRTVSGTETTVPRQS